MRLFHFTCTIHGRRGLGEQGFLLPGRDGLVWLTDLDFPMRRQLGLTTYVCDRGAERYEVDEPLSLAIYPWIEIRKRLSFEAIASVELKEGITVTHWYASAEPVAVHYSPLKG